MTSHLQGRPPTFLRLASIMFSVSSKDEVETESCQRLSNCFCIHLNCNQIGGRHPKVFLLQRISFSKWEKILLFLGYFGGGMFWNNGMKPWDESPWLCKPEYFATRSLLKKTWVNRATISEFRICDLWAAEDDWNFICAYEHGVARWRNRPKFFGVEKSRSIQDRWRWNAPSELRRILKNFSVLSNCVLLRLRHQKIARDCFAYRWDTTLFGLRYFDFHFVVAEVHSHQLLCASSECVLHFS